MRKTAHASQKQRRCTAAPSEVFAIAADFSRLPDWWLWMHPHPRIERDEHEVVDTAGAGLTAIPGAEFEIRSSGGAATLKNGRRTTWEPKTCRFRCELVEPDRRVRLILSLGQGDTSNGVTALDIIIEREDRGSRVTLRRESEVQGRGLLIALRRRAHNKGWALEKPLKRLAQMAEDPTAPTP